MKKYDSIITVEDDMVHIKTDIKHTQMWNELKKFVKKEIEDDLSPPEYGAAIDMIYEKIEELEDKYK